MNAARRIIGIVDVVTARNAGLSVAEVVDRSLDAGIRVILLRGKDVSDAELARVNGASIAQKVRAEGGVVLLHGDCAWSFDEGEVDGVHYGARRLWEPSPEVTSMAHGFSCHSRAELERAQRLGASWVTLSPFASTNSKPGYGPVLGVEGLRNLADGCSVPVFALAGISSETVAGVATAGAAGVALMGMLTARDLGSRLRALLHVMEEEPWLVQPPW